MAVFAARYPILSLCLLVSLSMTGSIGTDAGTGGITTVKVFGLASDIDRVGPVGSSGTAMFSAECEGFPPLPVACAATFAQHVKQCVKVEVEGGAGPWGVIPVNADAEACGEGVASGFAVATLSYTKEERNPNTATATGVPAPRQVKDGKTCVTETYYYDGGPGGRQYTQTRCYTRYKTVQDPPAQVKKECKQGNDWVAETVNNVTIQPTQPETWLPFPHTKGCADVALVAGTSFACVEADAEASAVADGVANANEKSAISTCNHKAASQPAKTTAEGTQETEIHGSFDNALLPVGTTGLQGATNGFAAGSAGSPSQVLVNGQSMHQPARASPGQTWTVPISSLAMQDQIRFREGLRNEFMSLYQRAVDQAMAGLPPPSQEHPELHPATLAARLEQNLALQLTELAYQDFMVEIYVPPTIVLEESCLTVDGVGRCLPPACLPSLEGPEGCIAAESCYWGIEPPEVPSGCAPDPCLPTEGCVQVCEQTFDLSTWTTKTCPHPTLMVCDPLGNVAVAAERCLAAFCGTSATEPTACLPRGTMP